MITALYLLTGFFIGLYCIHADSKTPDPVSDFFHGFFIFVAMIAWPIMVIYFAIIAVSYVLYRVSGFLLRSRGGIDDN